MMPTIYDQAHCYLEGKLSFPELREWLYSRIWDYFETAPRDQPPNSDLYSWMFGLFCDYDFLLDVLGDAPNAIDEAESDFRQSLVRALDSLAKMSVSVD